MASAARAALIGLVGGLVPLVILLVATSGLVPPPTDIPLSESELALAAADPSLAPLLAEVGPRPQNPGGEAALGKWIHDLPSSVVIPTRAPASFGRSPAPMPPTATPAAIASRSAQAPSMTLLKRPADGLGAAVPATIRRWESLILDAASRRGLDPNLIAALMMTESGGDPRAVSPKGAVGLMQVVGGPLEPGPNVDLGASILADNLARYGRTDLALAAYNAGAGAVEQYDGIPPFRETRDHVFRVMLRYELYGR